MGKKRAPKRRGKYSQDEIDYALGALMASAVRGPDGDWTPDFNDVAKRLNGPHRRTLTEWWKSRDRARDPQLRASATRGTEASAEAGARSWADSVHQRLAGCLDLALDELDKPTERGRDKNGRGWEIGANPAQRMAAIKTAHELADSIDARINDKGEREAAKIGSAMRRLKDALRRGGMDK